MSGSGNAQLCTAQTSCADCINLSPSCKWCSTANYTGSRCFSGTPAVNCSNVENPAGTVTGIDTATLSSLVQVSARQVNVTVRPGIGTSFSLSVQPANNYPLDVYLLTDLSYSFLDDLTTLQALGARIASSVQNISTNAQVGFGSFVDKKLAPFINILPALVNDPCAPPYGPGKCNPPYSYKHTVSLTTDGAYFSSRLQQQTISGNQDVPEGGWDGLMQAIVCKKLIGWRDNARHLLVFSTDANSHHAGDGLLGGVVRPNPHTCLMNNSITAGNVEYTLSETYDYPSLGDIREQLRLNDIIPIFAVTPDVQSIYNAVTAELASVGASTGSLQSDSGNIIQLIQTGISGELASEISTVSQRIVFDPVLPSGVTMTFTPLNCPLLGSDNVCNGVKPTQGAVNFTVSVQLTQDFCRANQGNTISVPVRIIGFGSFVVNISPLCGCPCQQSQISNSPFCTSNGTLTCGLCTCNPGRFGSSCQCDANGAQSGNATSCPTGPNNLPCSGQSRGSCICGKCACSQYQDIRLGLTSTYYGSACECDNSLCDTSNGQLCGGSSQGVCQCGGCQCANGFYGTACQCSNSLCVDPTDTITTRTCNGRGVCSCNQCTACKPPYTGQYCQSCQATDKTTCASQLCPPNLDCAKCALLNQTMCPSCPTTYFVNATTLSTVSGAATTECQYTDSDGCQDTYFVVQDTKGNVTALYVRTDKACPQPLAPAQLATIIVVPLVVIAIIAILILLTLLLIFWLLNRAEVRKFEKELARAKYTKNQNPLYVPANQQTKNPIYEGEKAQ
ncbi:hypothetical protein EMCRGX_G012580 [Ephydatia muelleri]